METFHTLEKETELRIDVASNDGGHDDLKEEVVTVTLLEGSAECFGAPLAERKQYTWGRGANLAVFTWYGCRLRVQFSRSDSASMVYESKEVNHMLAYINTHAQLEARRDHAAGVLAKAAQEGKIDGFGRPYPAFSSLVGGGVGVAGGRPAASGPRVLVCGPADRGKSALCTMLVNCAVRLGRAPLFVELDPALGSLGIPGAVSAAPVDSHTLSVTEGLEHASSAAFQVWFGATSVDADNAALYRAQVSRLALSVDARLCSDPSLATAGLVINTPGLFAEGGGAGAGGAGQGSVGHECLLHAIKAFRVDVVLVLDDRLYQQLRTLVGSSSPNSATGLGVAVVKLPRSEGVATRDQGARKALQGRRVRDYFYGPPVPATQDNLSSSASSPQAQVVGFVSTPALKPCLLEVPLNKVKLWRWAPAGLTAASGGLMPVVGSAHNTASSSSSSMDIDHGTVSEPLEGDLCKDAVLERVSWEEVCEQGEASLLHTVAAVLHEPSGGHSNAAAGQGGTGQQQPHPGSATLALLGHTAVAVSDGTVGGGVGPGGGGCEEEEDEEEAEAREGKRLARANVAGFVVLQRFSFQQAASGADEAKKSGRLSLLAPCPGKLPSLNLVISSGIKWMEG